MLSRGLIAIFLVLALASSSAFAAIDRLCMRRCYNQAARTAPPPCSPGLDLNDHESRPVFECSCSARFLEIATQCAITRQCSDASSPAAAGSEALSMAQDDCAHLGEHWNDDGTLITGVDGGPTSTAAPPAPVPTSNAPEPVVPGPATSAPAGITTAPESAVSTSSAAGASATGTGSALPSTVVPSGSATLAGTTTISPTNVAPGATTAATTSSRPSSAGASASLGAAAFGLATAVLSWVYLF
ncbi:hypothetical protein HDU67_001219 [Dinochytrium kinnereticum]|nr:hypothetical protein HDU67_001219 [Dinochytrium kinnereticum]